MKRRYKILLTVSEFMYSSQVRHLCDLASRLDRNIFDVEVGALAVGDEATKEIEALGVPYYRLRTLPPRSLSFQRLKDFTLSPFLLSKKKIDLVHSLLYQSLFTEPLIVKLSSGAKYVFTKSNLEWENHNLNWNLKSKFSDRIISISRCTDDLLAQKGFKNKTQKIFLGIDTEYFTASIKGRNDLRTRHSIQEGSVVFGCAAQFVEWKEHLTLLSAFERLCQRYNDIYLFFCGPNHRDAYYESVFAKITASPNKDRIVLLGTLKDMPIFYSAIDCFVLPSRNEPFGYVYIEAMSCNKPVIGCRAGGPLDIILENETGFFTNMTSPESLAEKMEIYLKNRDIIIQHGKLGRKRVLDLFSKEIMVRRHEELYLDVLKEPTF